MKSSVTQFTLRKNPNFPGLQDWLLPAESPEERGKYTVQICDVPAPAPQDAPYGDMRWDQGIAGFQSSPRDSGPQRGLNPCSEHSAPGAVTGRAVTTLSAGPYPRGLDSAGLGARPENWHGRRTGSQAMLAPAPGATLADPAPNRAPSSLASSPTADPLLPAHTVWASGLPKAGRQTFEAERTQRAACGSGAAVCRPLPLATLTCEPSHFRFPLDLISAPLSCSGVSSVSPYDRKSLPHHPV